ncbi:MAG TPA: hypothetical protein VLT59_10070 [Steroidobacteraceae bacterium]|nr:hypothetical protein [Steroidobacteraceae bacterium]
MLLHWLLVAHVAVVGYWLGSELVINNLYRYVSYSGAMPFAERDRLMQRVMDVDQHVRYALVLQAGLGFTLATLYGYVPGGRTAAFVAGSVAVAWLVFVEVIHRWRHRPVGVRLAAIDRGARYVVVALFVALAAGWLGTDWPMPSWLRLKLALFAGVMLCGVGIRFALIQHFRTWAIMAREGPNEVTNAAIRATYVRATAVLVLLWIFIAGITVTSVVKPTFGT